MNTAAAFPLNAWCAASWDAELRAKAQFAALRALIRAAHPEAPIMPYVEFFRERQSARYAVEKGRFKDCC